MSSGARWGSGYRRLGPSGEPGGHTVSKERGAGSPVSCAPVPMAAGPPWAHLALQRGLNIFVFLQLSSEGMWRANSESFWCVLVSNGLHFS